VILERWHPGVVAMLAPRTPIISVHISAYVALHGYLYADNRSRRRRAPQLCRERRMLELAASLACHRPVILGNAIPGLDNRNIRILVKSVLHASGHRQFPCPPPLPPGNETAPRLNRC